MKYCFVVFLSCILSCSHTPTSHRKAFEPLAEPNSAYSINLDLLTEQKITGRQALNLKKVATLSANQMDELKGYFKQRRPASSGETSVRVNVPAALKKNDYDALKNASLDQVISGASRLPQRQVDQLVSEVSALTACVPASLTLALAALAERDFPETDAIAKSTRLYQKTYDCGSGELRARAAYRLGLFALAQNDCTKSVPFWNVVNESSEVSFLFSRAEYWRNHCERQSNSPSGNQQQLALEFYNSFPLSYHSLQEIQDLDANEQLSKLVLARSVPKALVRTATSDQLNSLTEQIEISIENAEPNQAREYISWLNTVGSEKLQRAEPHFLLYLGHLAHLANDGLGTFQILAKAFSQYPQLKTETSLRLFYPKWYFDDIRTAAQNNGLDPLLVLALVRQESAFNSNAVSRVGARGLMQLMPATARGIDRSLTKQRLLDPKSNVAAGTVYFSRLVKRYNGNVALALAAYNAGYGAVDKWVDRYKVTNPVLFNDIIPYRETREYVASILRNYYWYQMLENREHAPKIILGEQLFPAAPITSFFDTVHPLHTAPATSDTENKISKR